MCAVCRGWVQCSLDIDEKLGVAVTSAREGGAHDKIDYQGGSLSVFIIIIMNKTSGFADDGLAMVTGDIMKLDSISIEVVENCEADLVTFSVVWLGSSRAKRVYIYYLFYGFIFNLTLQ